MKKILNKNMIIICCFYLLLIGYYLFIWFDYLYLQNGVENNNLIRTYYNTCERYLEANEKTQKELFDNYKEDFILDKKSCEKLIIKGAKPVSTFKVFKEFLFADRFLIPFFIPIVVILPFLLLLSKEYNGRYVKTFCLRKKYKDYIKHIYGIAYKRIYLVPLMIIVTFIISYIIAEGNMDIRFDLASNFLLTNVNFIWNIKFYFMYILVLFLNMGIYTNVALTIINNNKKFIISLIESFICIYIIWAISEIGMGIIFQSNFNIPCSNFSLLNIYDWSEVTNIDVYFLNSFILFIITFIISYKSCCNKERFIQMCEK